MIRLFLTKWRDSGPLFRLRLFLGLVILLLILVFLFLKIVPGGTITYSRNWPAGFRSGQGFIYDFKPAERIDLTDDQALKIIAEPLYFSLFTPRLFDRVKVTVKYRTPANSNLPILEIGVLKDKLSGRYDFKPLENKILDYWRLHWSRLEDSDSRLILSAEPNPLRSEDFFSALKAGRLPNCPSGPETCVATYNYPLDLNYRLPDYAPLSPLVISQPLRGTHQFYVYFKKENWRLNFNFVDLNQDRGQDPITVSLSAGDRIIATEALPDNNPAPVSGQTEDKTLTLSGIAPAAGIYKIDVKVSDDIVISKINSSSDKLVAIHRVWPVSGADNLTLFSDASYLSVTTANPASLGEIYFAGQKLSLDQTDRQFIFPSLAGPQEIKIKKNDLVLENNGVFAFSRRSLFNPEFKKVDRYFLPGDDIKYIIATYQSPLGDEDLKTATAELSLLNAYRENGKYTFTVSRPGLNGSDPADYLEIKEISLALSGKTLGAKIKSWFIRD